MPRKPIITAFAAASLATSGASAGHVAATVDDDDILEVGQFDDDFVIYSGPSGDTDLLITIDEPEVDDLGGDDIYLAQTLYGGGPTDRITSPGDVPGARLKQPGKGITLDNGLKKPGKLKLQKQEQSIRKDKKKKKKN